MIPATRGLISRLSIFEPKTTVIPATRGLLQTKAAQGESESEENFQFLGLFGRKKMQVEILVQAPPPQLLAFSSDSRATSAKATSGGRPSGRDPSDSSNRFFWPAASTGKFALLCFPSNLSLVEQRRK